MRTLYLSDLDGTLLNPSARLSDFSRDTLTDLIRQGMMFSYATARSIHSAQKVLDGFMPAHPVIVYNGAMILDPQTLDILHLERFVPGEIEAIRAIFREFGLSPLVYGFVDGRERVSFLEKPAHPGVSHYLKSRAGDARLRPAADENRLFAGQPFYFTLIGDRTGLEDAHQALLRADLGQITFQREIYRNEYWLEIMPRGATKAHALAWLSRRLGAERTVCFGDALNDLPLFQAADEAYAVQNAHPDLKRLARGILPSNAQDGVTKFLRAHFFGKNPGALCVSDPEER